MIAEYLGFPRVYKKISTKLKTCKKRRDLEKRLSKSVINLMEEEESGYTDIFQSQREARKYLNLARKAFIVDDIRKVVRNHAQKSQELTFTGDIFGIDYKTKNTTEDDEIVKYNFFIATKKYKKVREERRERIREITSNVLELAKKEEAGEIRMKHVKTMAKEYLIESKNMGCINYVRSRIVKHMEKTQEYTITGSVFGINYKINRDNENISKIYNFFAPKKQKLVYA